VLEAEVAAFRKNSSKPPSRDSNDDRRNAPEGTWTLLTGNAEVTVKGGRLGRLLEPLMAWQARPIGNRFLNAFASLVEARDAAKPHRYLRTAPGVGQAKHVGALRRWLGQRGAQPSELLRIATSFPTAERAIREALEILL
jgi:hypothetical protein